jgi:hypothetical protein
MLLLKVLTQYLTTTDKQMRSTQQSLGKVTSDENAHFGHPLSLFGSPHSPIAMTATKKTLLVIGSAVGVVVLVFAGFLAMFYSSMVSTVMTKRSPDRQHTAKLTRVDGIDVIFKVTIDGTRVYSSPDFAPVSADFREQLIWGSDSMAVVLEVAGRRIYGYHVGEKRSLTDSELHQVHLTPFEELRFEGTLPKDVVAR